MKTGHGCGCSGTRENGWAEHGRNLRCGVSGMTIFRSALCSGFVGVAFQNQLESMFGGINTVGIELMITGVLKNC